MNLSLLIENAMYGLSQLFMLPVLLLARLSRWQTTSRR